MLEFMGGKYVVEVVIPRRIERAFPIEPRRYEGGCFPCFGIVGTQNKRSSRTVGNRRAERGSTPSQSPDTLIGRRLPGGALLFMLCRTNSASGERRNAFTRILFFMYIENRAFHLLPRISRASPEITYRTHSVGSVPLPAWSRHI